MLSRRFLSPGLLAVGIGILVTIATTLAALCLWLLSVRRGNTDSLALGTVITSFIAAVRQPSHLLLQFTNMLPVLCRAARSWHGRCHGVEVIAARRTPLSLPADAFKRPFQRSKRGCVCTERHTLRAGSLIALDLLDL